MNKKSQDTYDVTKEFDLNIILDNHQRMYIENRVIAQIKWYDSKAVRLQRTYKTLLISVAILTAMVPVLTFLSDLLIIKIIIALMGSSSSVMSYIISINSYKELWLRYRCNCELLKSELHKYLCCADTSKNDNFDAFVEKCEDCLTSEFLSWKDNQTDINNQFSSSTSS